MKKVSVTFTILVGITMLLLPVIANAESDSSRINRQRKAIGRALLQVQAENWPAVLQYYTEDIEYHDPIVTIEGIGTMAEFLARLFESTPDLVTTIEDETCINGIYAASWTMVGDFNEVPYTAKGMSIIKFRPRETRAYYQRDYYTEGDIMINIPGLDEPTMAFRTYYRCAVDPTFDCPFDTLRAGAAPEDDTARPGEPSSSGAFELQQNVPNPFNPFTTIAFEVPAGGARVTLRIYDISGRLVKTLVDGYEPSGARSVHWNGTNDQDQPVASGIYYYQLTGPAFAEKKKMVLLK